MSSINSDFCFTNKKIIKNCYSLKELKEKSIDDYNYFLVEFSIIVVIKLNKTVNKLFNEEEWSKITFNIFKNNKLKSIFETITPKIYSQYISCNIFEVINDLETAENFYYIEK